MLDGQTNVYLAYSSRRLLTSYTGPAIRARRSTPDTTEVDINFGSNGLVDATALSAHVGSGDWQLARIYDQSTQGIYVQNISGKGPYGKQTGTDQTLGTQLRLAPKYNASLPTAIARAQTGSLIPGQIGGNFTIFAAFSYNTHDFPAAQTIFAKRDANGRDVQLGIRKSDHAIELKRTDVGVTKQADFTSGMTVGNSYIMALRVTGFTTAECWVNGAQKTQTVNTLTSNVDAAVRIDLGSQQSSGDFFTGKMGEIIVFNSAKSNAQIASIFAAMNAHFGIY
jgi:hypothetical protein